MGNRHYLEESHRALLYVLRAVVPDLSVPLSGEVVALARSRLLVKQVLREKQGIRQLKKLLRIKLFPKRF